MKKTILVLMTALLALGGSKAYAQVDWGPNKDECLKYVSYYEEYFKQKNYAEALPHWRKAYALAPKNARQTIYINGIAMFKNLLRQPKLDAAYRKAIIDTVFMLYDQRAENFPKNRVTALNNKGMDMANLMKGQDEVLFENFNAIIAENQEKTNPSLFILDMQTAINLFQNSKIDAEAVINTYQNSIALLEKAPADEKEKAEKVRTDLESLFIGSKVADCDNLVALFTPRFEADPDNIELVKNIVKMLGSTEGGIETPLFLKAVTSMHKQEPSALTAYNLYRLNSAQGNTEEAVKYLEEAISYPETDDATKGSYFFELATYCLKNGNNAKAYEYAEKAARMNSEFAGKSFYLIGTIWGSTVCGGNEIQRRSPYWVAVDYLQKAMNADPSLADDCRKLIGQYAAYYPQKAEAFMYDVTDGQTYTVACGGMRATTTVRTQK